jgi:hypothetical protein
MRERLRERRREREARLLDLGALVYELHRQGKRAPELLQNKAAELALIDSEVRDLEAALAGEPAAALVDETPPEEETPEEETPEEETYEADALDEEQEEHPQ